MVDLGEIELVASPGKASLAVHIMLREYSIPFSISLVDLESDIATVNSYSSVPPDEFSRVPALRFNKVWYRETLAMLLFLDERSRRVLPESDFQRITYFSWLSYLATTVHPIFSQIARPERFNCSSDPSLVIDEGKKHAFDLVMKIERDLFSYKFALSDEFTCIDAYLAAIYRWAWRIGLDLERSCPRWTNWAKRISNRPAVLESMQLEGVSLFPTENIEFEAAL